MRLFGYTRAREESSMKTHIALLSVLAFAASAPAQSTMAPLLTRAWDNHRSGWNQHETVLTQANVKAKGIARITTIPVCGVDATTGVALWQTPPLGTPITGSDSLGPNGPGAMCPGPNQTIDCYQINDKWGVISTGVIDPDTQRVYLVAWVSPDGTPQNGRYYLYTLNIPDGTQATPAVL